MNVLIVCHAGSSLGLGHLTRSLVIAKAFREHLGAEVHLLIQGETIQRTDLSEYDHMFIGLGNNLLESVSEFAQVTAAKVVVFDLHPRLVPADIDRLLIELRKGHCKIISVDGFITHQGNLDLVFIPSFGFSPPEGFCCAVPVLYGWDCFLLNVISPFSEWMYGKKVLVLTGGTDATGLGKSLPMLLNEALLVDTELHWVTGPYSEQPVFPVSPKFSIMNHQAPSRLYDLMVSSNYAITVYGVSFFELLYYGVPTVVFSPYGNKDDAELAVIAAEGVALVARDEIDAVDKLKKLMYNDLLAASFSQCARKKLSVQGDHKFVQAVFAMMD